MYQLLVCHDFGNESFFVLHVGLQTIHCGQQRQKNLLEKLKENLLVANNVISGTHSLA